MQNSKHPLVSVVIPSWNSERQLKQNLRYVFAAAAEVNAEVVIVDGNSQFDDSIGYLKSLGGKIRLFINIKDGSFSSNVNTGVKKAKGEYIMLLNTDVRPSRDCFAKALAYFKDPQVYAVTFNSGEAWAAGKWNQGLLEHFSTTPNSQEKKAVSESLWASGGQAAFRKSMWLKLGGMDLLYKPFYWEDVDMGYRAWKRGWRILWAPDCKCVHDHQKSVIATNFTKEFVLGTAQRNQFLFVWKNITDRKLMLSHLVRLPLFLKSYPKPLLRALLLLPTALRSRAIEKQATTLSDQQVLAHWSSLA